MAYLYESYSTTPGNNTAAPPTGAPENQTKVSDFNNIARQLMATVAELGTRTPKIAAGADDQAEVGTAAFAATSAFAAANAAVPIGGVIPFLGTAAQIPANFVELDGSTVNIQYPGGTQAVTLPDARGRYLKSTAVAQTAGATGGNATGTTSAEGAHDHGGQTQDHTLTIAEMPLHGHPSRISAFTASSAASATTGGLMLSTQSNTNFPAHTGTPSATAGDQIGGEGGGGAHNHGVISEDNHSHTVPLDPEFVALRMIIRLS